MDTRGSVGISSRPIQLIAALQRPRESSGLYFSYATVVISAEEKNGMLPFIATYAEPLYAGISEGLNLGVAFVVVVVVVALLVVVVVSEVVVADDVVLDELIVSELFDKLSVLLDISSLELESETEESYRELDERESLLELSNKLQPVAERQIRADSIKDNIFRLICFLVIILTSPYMISSILQGYFITSFLVCGNFFGTVSIQQAAFNKRSTSIQRYRYA